MSPLVGYKTLAKQTPFGYHALRINGRFVSPEVFQAERNSFFMRWRRNAAMLRKTDEERNDMMLDEIIEQEIVADFLYHHTKVTVTNQETEDYINRYIKPRYPTIDGMNAYMSQSGNYNMADLQKTIKLYLYKLKYFPKVAKRFGITIPPAELETAYQQHVIDNQRVTARHILITGPDPEKAKQLAETIYTQLKNGADFNIMAAQNSQDSQTRATGGFLGSFSMNETLPEIAEKVFQAKSGALIPPFQTKMGYEIIKVEKFVYYFHPKNEFAGMMLVEKFGTSNQYQQWLSQWKAKQKIEILDPGMKAYRLYREGQFSQAGSCYEKAYAENRFENNLIRALECYLAAENWVKLTKLGQTGMNRFPSKVTYYLHYAEGLYRTGKVQSALDIMKQAEDLSKNNIYEKNLVSQTYSRLGLENEAIRVKQNNPAQ
jgi:foldase protein PrsA